MASRGRPREREALDERQTTFVLVTPLFVRLLQGTGARSAGVTQGAGAALERKAAEFRDGGGTVLAATTGICFGAAPLLTTYTIGALAEPLSVALRCSRTEVMAVSFMNLLATLPMSVVVGWLVDRVGVRRLVLCSQLLFGLSFAAIGAYARDLIALYALYFIAAVCGAGTLPIPFVKSVSSRFDRHRGFALGLAMSGTGLCGMIAPIYVSWAIDQFGWRLAYAAVGALPVVIGFPLSYLFLAEPLPDRSPPSRSDEGADAARPSWPGSLRLRFVVMAGIFFAFSLSVSGAIPNLIPLLKDAGLEHGDAARLAAALGGAVVIGRLVVGRLLDLFWPPGVGCAAFLPVVVGLLLLAWPGAAFFSFLTASILIGVGTGAELDITAFLVARYFGLASYGRLYATQFVILGSGAALGAPMFALVRDITGSYAPALTGSAVVIALSAVALLGLEPRRSTIGPGSD